MTDRSRKWQWDKQGDHDGHARFHYEMVTGVTLSSPTCYLHELTSTSPETWVDRSSEVTITGTVVNALDDDGVVISGGTSRAVRVIITADTETQPDVTDEPTPGKNYRVKIVATRSDTARPISREVPLEILP